MERQVCQSKIVSTEGFTPWHCAPNCASSLLLLCPTTCYDVFRAFAGQERKVHEIAGDNRRYLVALPGIEPGFED